MCTSAVQSPIEIKLPTFTMMSTMFIQSYTAEVNKTVVRKKQKIGDMLLRFNILRLEIPVAKNLLYEKFE